MIAWSDRVLPEIEVIAKGPESLFAILDVAGDYEANDFVNTRRQTSASPSSASGSRIPYVDRQDENGHLTQAPSARHEQR
ncbi:hypothetical protein ACFVZC_37410 [Streptomyces marokkonensis]|uniref:Uncharacterized protein n=1 Tax=Streptomyces marokkonensis TaxID=324855 RepID=A0ABW6QID8_9ACTN